MITRHRIFIPGAGIDTLEVLEGQLPRLALNLVREWAMMRRAELLEDRRFCRNHIVPANIDPLA